MGCHDTSAEPKYPIRTSYFSLGSGSPMFPMRREPPSANLAATRERWARVPTLPKVKEPSMKTPMFASIRKYSRAPLLADEMVNKQDEIKSALRQIRAIHSSYLLKTSDGAISMTVCDDRAGADESNRVATT